jgi:hypothetical protein
MDRYDEGTRVSWRWGAHTARGQIARIFEADVSRSIEGTDVKRHASKDEPAYMIEQDDGARVLKSHSELTRLS